MVEPAQLGLQVQGGALHEQVGHGAGRRRRPRPVEVAQGLEAALAVLADERRCVVDAGQGGARRA